MSLSKGQLMVDAAVRPRQPKCTRCRHHGIIVPKKGHLNNCPFLKCECWKCYLITQRTQITALQRNLKKAENSTQNKEQRPCARAGTSGVKPAAKRACSASAPDGGARSSLTSGLNCPPADHAADTAWRPLDLRSRPAAGRESVAAFDNGKVLPFASSERGSRTPLNVPHFSEFGQAAPLPVSHYPFRMSGHFPSSNAPCPDFLLNMPWLRPLPAGLHHDGLCSPLMFPYFQSSAVRYPPPPEPGPLAEEMMSRQPPLSTGRHK